MRQTILENTGVFTRIKLWQVAAISAVAIFLAYSNHFHNSFHFDDSHAVVQNVYIRSLDNIPKFFRDASTFSSLPANRTWRPLVSASLAIDYWLGGGLNPLAFHISTFCWFLALLAVLFFLYREILRRSAPAEPWIDYCALFAAVWFGLHPVMAETVNYIIQRADLYSTLGVAAALLIYSKFPTMRTFGLYCLPAALGILCKPPAAVFPVILVAYIFLFEENAAPQRLLSAIKKAWLAFAITALLMLLESRMTPASYTPGIVSAHDYIATQPYVALRYFLSFFLPLRLSADTDLSPFTTFYTDEGLLGLVFLIALLGGIRFTAANPRRRPICFGLCWFVLALLPTALFPLSEVENDHRMFFPFAGLVLAVTWALALALRNRLRRAALAAVAIVVLLCYGCGVWKRNQVWLNEETLWKDVSVKSPRNGRGLMNYGLSIMAKGRTAEALTYFERAAQFTPNYSILEINHAIALAALGRDEEAMGHFQRAMQLAPNDAQPYYYFGRWLQQKGRGAEAVTPLRQAIALNPDFLDPRYDLMRAYSGLGDTASLRALAGETLRLAPGDPLTTRFLNDSPPKPSQRPGNPSQTPEAYLELSLAHHRARRFRECIAAAREALKLRPDYAEAYNNLAAGYEALGEWDEAIAAASAAVRIRPDFQLARNNLAYSLSEKQAGEQRKRQ